MTTKNAERQKKWMDALKLKARLLGDLYALFEDKAAIIIKSGLTDAQKSVLKEVQGLVAED